MIIRPDPTSLIESASSVYPRVEKYRSQRRTGGIWLILTKKLDTRQLDVRKGYVTYPA